MKKYIHLLLLLLPFITLGQELTNDSEINIKKTWSQEAQGYTYPMAIHVPNGPPPEHGFPVCILLHGKTGNGGGMIGSYKNFITSHALIAPTGYQNTWNICSEVSNAPDMEMIKDLLVELQEFSNINSNQIRIFGFSNGAELANRVFIENDNTSIDAICTLASQLITLQYHFGKFYKPENQTDPFQSFCGYTTIANPLSTRKYLSICNKNDVIVPYNGGTSEVAEVDYLHAETAAFLIAKNQGYNGNQLTGQGTPIGNPEIFEFSYFDGKVVHLSGTAGHAANLTQKNYIENFFLETINTSVSEEKIANKIKVYPNPAVNYVKIIDESRSIGNDYSIIDLGGKILHHTNSQGYLTNISLDSFQSGIYLLKIKGSDNLVTFKKLLIQKNK